MAQLRHGMGLAASSQDDGRADVVVATAVVSGGYWLDPLLSCRAISASTRDST